ncbi:S-ribosylhomocysteine lyase [Candidatus Providencia siddallii]|uniref:S-ribosylhomocysteine lyase n=1 Tax=Candidatus Providencia siddallii TaxID=1715285 RepID=A0A0M6W711_9GAMM|nr:S-ribosylhomocysteine lyase [Candidatus Providencia siddallii]
MMILNSFTIDHTRITAPSIRVAKTIQTHNNDIISVFDLRFTTPNKEIMPESGMHTIEHFFVNYMYNHINTDTIKIIDISPMGCRTGFYMSLIGKLDKKNIIYTWISAMQNILTIQDQNKIPGLNIYQCGNYKMHSLKEAKQIAYKIINSKIKIIKNYELKFSLDKCKNINKDIQKI